jgi:phage-related protein
VDLELRRNTMETLTIKPYGDIEETHKWYTNTVVFTSGKKQKQKQRVNAEKQWKVTFSGIDEDRVSLDTFFDARSGDLEPFYFTINGELKVVRFATDSLSWTIKRQLQDPVAYTCQCVLEEVI